jgi:APA family basic amino acid/polyamine antiporter
LHIPGVGTFYLLEYIGRKLVTVGILILFTIINCFSVQQSSWIQRFLTGLKIGSILFAIFFIFMYSSENHLSLSFQRESNYNLLGWPGFVAALAGAFWCYDGWNNVTFVAGEIKQPEKVISKSLLTGLLICTLIYVLFNLALFYVLPFETIQSSPFVAATALESVFGSMGGLLMAGIVIVSVLGAVNGNILSCSRVTYSFAKDHSILNKIGEIHPKYKTPFYAIIANTLWAIVLIMSGSFDQLTDILIFVSWIFYGLSAMGVIMLRIKNPSQPRPYKVPGYPWVPLVFILFTFFYLATTIYSDVYSYQQGIQPVVKCFVGGILVFFGLPLYFYSSRRLGK